MWSNSSLVKDCLRTWKPCFPVYIGPLKCEHVAKTLKTESWGAQTNILLPRYDHAKGGRLSEKEFYNVVALQHKVPCTLKEVPRRVLLNKPFNLFFQLSDSGWGRAFIVSLVNQLITNELLFSKTDDFISHIHTCLRPSKGNNVSGERSVQWFAKGEADWKNQDFRLHDLANLKPG